MGASISIVYTVYLLYSGQTHVMMFVLQTNPGAHEEFAAEHGVQLDISHVAADVKAEFNLIY